MNTNLFAVCLFAASGLQPRKADDYAPQLPPYQLYGALAGWGDCRNHDVTQGTRGRCSREFDH
jgi:hypothetical protein